MEDFIQNSVRSLSDFLSQHKDKRPLNPLVSFAFQANKFPNFDFDSLIKYFPYSFYFEKPEEKSSLLCLNNVLLHTENGDKRFASVDKQIKKLRENFLSNSKEPFPLLVGGMKFNVEHDDNEWKDFPDSLWFIPELTLYNSSGKNHFIFNFIYNTSDENLIEKFKTRMELISKPISKNSGSDNTQIKNLVGNTPKDKKKWKGLINSALEKISDNEVQKVVLARKLEMILSEEVNFNMVKERLTKKYPDCYTFVFHSGKSFFFGATPERLAKFQDNKIELEALAGSAPRGSNEKDDAALEKQLLESKKDMKEHKFVVNYLMDAVSKFSEDISCNENPELRKLNNIQHLSTKISAKLGDDSSIFNILKEITPTPAVCGTPKDSALNLIKKLESFNRGLYSGFVGWTNLSNLGEFAVTIRSALTFNNKLFNFAGCGILNGSDPDLEFDETNLKFKAILSLFDENK